MLTRLGTILCLVAIIYLSACVSETYAPVTEINPIEPIPKKGVHRVLSDETLYSIAWRYGMDYRDLAKRNDIHPPYPIHTGQIIYLRKDYTISQKSITLPPPVKLALKPAVPKVIKTPGLLVLNKEKEPTSHVAYWRWPAHGPTLNPFSVLNKGINIGGALGSPVLATAAGKVVYSGHGLRSYGNLIIIKHNSTYLSAYAHNSKVFVKDGDWVKIGQKIAEMGDTGTQRVMLHFEMRRNGRPVNPLIYLTKKV